MSKHTPGPWVTAYDDGGITPDTASGNRIFDIARIYWPDRLREAEYRANARLVAAAPDLLAALRGAALAIGNWSRPTGANGMTSPRPDDPLVLAMHAAYAAIAKAEGK